MFHKVKPAKSANDAVHIMCNQITGLIMRAYQVKNYKTNMYIGTNNTNHVGTS